MEDSPTATTSTRLLLAILGVEPSLPPDNSLETIISMGFPPNPCEVRKEEAHVTRHLTHGRHPLGMRSFFRNLGTKGSTEGKKIPCQRSVAALLVCL